MLPRDLLICDLETRSRVDLRVNGGRRYAQSPTTEVMCGGWLDPREGVLVVWSRPAIGIQRLGLDDACWPKELAERLGFEDVALVVVEGDEPPALVQALALQPWMAHNAANFDAQVWRGLYPDLTPSSWWDSLPLCSAFSLPRSIEQLGRVLYEQGKDSGQKLMLQLSKPIAKGRQAGRFLPLTAGNVPALIRYLVADILLLAAVTRDHLAPLVDRWPDELDVLAADGAINERGIRFDVGLARRVIELEGDLREGLAAELLQGAGDALGTTVAEARALLRSQPRFLRCLSDVYGITLPDATRGTLYGYLEAEDPPEAVRALLLARIGETRITSAKLLRGCQVVDPDGRLRGILQAHGAHTGRWSGRAIQLHNLPRPAPGVDLDGALALARRPVSEFIAGTPEGVTPGDQLSALVRASLRPSEGRLLAIADYANIEARVLLWLAGDGRGLEVFKTGGDPYKDFASQLFAVPASEVTKAQRAVGKIGVLGCGYGMSAKRMDEQAAGFGVDLEAAGVTGREVVEGWRDAFPRIAGRRSGRMWEGVEVREGGLWRKLNGAFVEAIRDGRRSEVGRCVVWRDAELDAVVIELPSGRPLLYREARMEQRERFGKLRISPVYTQHRGRAKLTVDVYGGKLVENITQAVARDLLAHALVLLEELGHEVVLHVHDEVLAEVSEEDPEGGLRQLLDLLVMPPFWAPGLPLEAEGFTAAEYRKSPPPGGRVLTARACS